jgi:hypothetical protein
VGFTVLAIEALYFLAPNVKQRFLATLPGAVLSAGCWIGLGAELNAELPKISNEGTLQKKHEPPAVTRIDRAA